jgi:iron complex outermembrane receptor protein
MNLNQSKLRTAVRFALCFGATGLMAGTALAQDEATELERIEVTGSRIRQVEAETAQPILTIGRAEIEKQGFASVADILQNVSAIGTPPISRASPLSAGEAVGGQYISLRNLGAARTLILINGRRMTSTTGGIQDLSAIPAAAVERIEILKDSASTIYGADAIAGVVNVVTRSNFEGMRASGYYGQYDEGDGEVEVYDFVTGHSSDRGSITMAVEYRKENSVAATDRAFSAFPNGQYFPNLGWTPVSQWGGWQTTATTGVPGLPTGTRVVLRPGGDPTNINDFVRQDQTAPNGQVNNTLEQTDLRTPLSTRQIFISGNYDLTDSVRFFSETIYSHREASRQVAGYPMQGASFGIPVSADSYFNPTDASIGNWWHRTWEVPRVSDSDLEAFRIVLGLDGSFEIGDRYFDWDLSWNYGDQRVIQASYGNLNLANTRAALGPSFVNSGGQLTCGTATAVIAGCVPWNPWIPAGTVAPGGITGNQALQEFLFQTEHSIGQTSTQVVSANLSGLLFTLPAGDLQFAGGVERRKEKGEFTPDALSVSGGSTNLGARPTEGSYDVNEAYLEFQIPLLADLAFAKELSINLASRYSDFDTFGSTSNSKFSVQWRPIDDLLVRGTWAEGFRAPTISNLFAGGSQTFASYTDPCDGRFGAAVTSLTTRQNCAAAIANYLNPDQTIAYRQLQQGFVPTTTASAQTPLAFFSGAANPNLTPEESISKTLGLVYSPSYIDGLTVSLDWWNIELENTIVADTPGSILSDCYVEGNASRCSSSLFTRDPVLGIVNNMNYGNRNAGLSNDEGWDFGTAYRLSTGFGDFGFNLQTTYTSVSESKSTNVPTALLTQAVSFGSNFRVRGNAGIDWSYGDFGVSWNARYFSKIKETCLNAVQFPEQCSDPNYLAGNPAQSRAINVAGSNTFHDLQVRWSAPWNATVSVGANNVFEHEGPQLYSQPSANTPYYGGFDIGRFVYARYTQNF